MENNITLEGTELFNSTREPWHKWVSRSKKTDTLGYIKNPKFREEGYPIYLVPDWNQIKESYLPYKDGKTPYYIMIDTRPDRSDWDRTPVMRLGTVFIPKSEEVEENEQSLLESIMSEPEIKDSLQSVFKQLNYQLGEIKMAREIRRVPLDND